MPFGFMRIRTTTANPGRQRPSEVEASVRQVVEAVGAKLEAIYFSVGSETAVAVVKDLDEFVKIKTVTGALDPISFEKFVGTELAEKAFDDSNALRPSAA